MKKILLIVAVVLGLAALANAQKLVILHTNDMHSKLTGFGPVLDYSPMVINNDKTIGGFARLATLIKQERAKNPGKVLVLDDGDFLMGTVFHALEPQTGFQLHLMKEMGYDYTTLGNHEFDFGPEVLAEIIENAEKAGGIPQIVTGSLKFSPEPGDDKLQKLYDQGVIKPYSVFEKNGLKIGIFGLLGPDAIKDIKFAAPLQFNDMVKVAKKYTKLLRDKENVDIVICLSHGGVYPDGNGGYYGEDIDLAKKVKDIDIIISGHSHVATPKYIKTGKTIIVQTGSYVHNLGRLEIDYNDGKVDVVDFKLIPVDDKIMGDEYVHKQILKQERLVDSLIFKPLGLAYHKPVAEIGYNMYHVYKDTAKPAPVGNFVTDAVKYYVDQYAGGTDVALTANGTVREDILKGPFSPPDAFRVMSLGFGQDDFIGYPLMRIYLTGRELKKLMDLILFSNEPGTDSYLYFSGLTVYYDPDGGFLNKVQKIVLSDGREVDLSKNSKELYSLTTDSYLMSFLGEIKKMSYGLVKIVPKDADGRPITDYWKYRLDFDKNKPGIQEGKQWLALIAFAKHFPDNDNDGLPDIPEYYKEFHDVYVPVKNGK